VVADEYPNVRLNFEEYFQGLMEEKQKNVAILLDYVMNYNKSERTYHKLDEMNLQNEKNDLLKLGVLNGTEKYHKGYRYEILSVNQTMLGYAEELVEKQLYPLFSETEKIGQKIHQIVEGNFSSGLKLFEQVTEYETLTSYSLSSDYFFDEKSRAFGNTLSKCGFGYYTGYRTVKAANYSDDFIFRTAPINIKSLFLEIMKEEIQNRLSSLPEKEKWCMFLRYVNPNADDEFFLANRAKFLPGEIREAEKKISEFKKASMDRFELVLNEIENTFSRILKNLFVRDVHCLWNLSLLLALGDIEGNMYRVQRFKMEKLKEIDAAKLNKTMDYVDTFSQEGLVLRDRGTVKLFVMQYTASSIEKD
jgi:hypothetical protein